MAKKRKYSPQQTKKAIPALKEFNALSKTFIQMMNRKVAEKQKSISKIRVLVTGFENGVPKKEHNISVLTIDMNRTRIKQKGKFSFYKKMDWESDIPNRNRGIIL